LPLTSTLNWDLIQQSSPARGPGHAAAPSAQSFLLGALLPLVAILLPPPGCRVPITVVAVLVTLALIATVSARLSGRTRAEFCYA
jgi:VIT1/CCC1 family predicted Fe2+/Mn2+ transporter